MDLRLIAAFLAVAEERHFGRAAARLHLAEPPLSQQIRRLERDLGVRLFERTTRSVRPTAAGEALIGPARQILRDVELAKFAVRAANTGDVGRVVLGFSGASNHVHLPRLARAVREQLPSVQLVLARKQYAQDVLNAIVDRSIDIGFVRLPTNHEDVKTRVIQREDLVVALPSDHRLAESVAVDPGELAQEPFVAFPDLIGSAVRDAMVRVCLESGFRPRIVQAAPDTYSLLELVAAGVGITLTVSSVQYLADSALAFRPLRPARWSTWAALGWRAVEDASAVLRVLDIAEKALPTASDGTRGLAPASDGYEHVEPSDRVRDPEDRVHVAGRYVGVIGAAL